MRASWRMAFLVFRESVHAEGNDRSDLGTGCSRLRPGKARACEARGGIPRRKVRWRGENHI
jgi:hypothetical protein